MYLMEGSKCARAVQSLKKKNLKVHHDVSSGSLTRIPTMTTQMTLRILSPLLMTWMLLRDLWLRKKQIVFQ